MGRKIQLFLFVFLLSMVVFGTTGCMQAAVKKTNYSLRHPAYPAEPKIAYLRSYYGSASDEYLGFFDKIIGSAASQKMRGPVQPVYQKDTLYITVRGDAGIIIIDSTKKTFTELTEISGVTLKSVEGLAVASTGDIYVSDPNANNIYMIDRNGDLKRTISGAALKIKRTGLLALDEVRGRLYVVDKPANAVKALSTTGELLFEFGGKGADDGQFDQPYGIAVDKRNGRLVVVDSSNYRIQVFDDNGKFIRKFGENSDSPTGFGGPRGVAVNNEGHIYVSDAMLHRISVFTDEGVSLSYFGGPGRAPGFFQLPNGIAFDDQDRFYVSDDYNGRVQVFQYLSEQWKKEHPEEYSKYSAKPEEKVTVQTTEKK